MNIDELLIKNAGWTWDKLRESRALEYQLGEESITDFIILNLKKYGAGKLVVKSFTRHAESLNGADWEWWFTGPSGKWLGMRVQAKVISVFSDNYEHLYHTNKHGAQVDLLINDAVKKKMVPLYCMYSNWDSKAYMVSRKCKTYKPSVRHYGNSILDPGLVKHFQKTKTKDLASLISHLFPMHCIFCCKGYSPTGDLPERALYYLKASGFTTYFEENNEDVSQQLLKTEVPNYVMQVFRGNIVDSVESPYHDGPKNIETLDVDDNRLKRIMVVQEKNNI